MALASPIRPSDHAQDHDPATSTRPGLKGYTRGCRCLDCHHDGVRAKRWVSLRMQGLSTRAIAEHDGVDHTKVARATVEVAPDRPWESVSASPISCRCGGAGDHACTDARGNRMCSVCGKAFDPPHPNSRVCSEDHFVIHQSLTKFLTGRRQGTNEGSVAHRAAVIAHEAGYPVFDRLPNPVKDLVLRTVQQ